MCPFLQEGMGVCMGPCSCHRGARPDPATAARMRQPQLGRTPPAHTLTRTEPSKARERTCTLEPNPARRSIPRTPRESQSRPTRHSPAGLGLGAPAAATTALSSGAGGRRCLPGGGPAPEEIFAWRAWPRAAIGGPGCSPAPARGGGRMLRSPAFRGGRRRPGRSSVAGAAPSPRRKRKQKTMEGPGRGCRKPALADASYRP